MALIGGICNSTVLYYKDLKSEIDTCTLDQEVIPDF
jgi:hypothetical protein